MGVPMRLNRLKNKFKFLSDPEVSSRRILELRAMQFGRLCGQLCQNCHTIFLCLQSISFDFSSVFTDLQSRYSSFIINWKQIAHRINT